MIPNRPKRVWLAAGLAAVAGMIGANAQSAVQPFGFDPAKHWYDLGTGVSVPDTDWRKARGHFGGALLLTQNIAVFLNRWRNMSSSQAPTIDMPSRVRRGDTVTVVLFYSGCGLSGAACQATVDFLINRPDGTIYGNIPGVIVPSGQTMSPRVVYISRAGPSIHIDPTDPFGKYTVRANLHETASAPPMTLKQSFEVVP